MVIVVVVAMSCTVFVVPRSRQHIWTVVAVASVVMMVVTALAVADRIVDLNQFVWMRRDSRLMSELRLWEKCPSAFLSWILKVLHQWIAKRGGHLHA